MKLLAAALSVVIATTSPAAAHKLRVFATVEGQNVRGYAFFVGGGRPEGSAWVAKGAAGNIIASGTTDAEGRFTFGLPAAASTDVTVTVDTHEAHMASTTLSASRLMVAPITPPASASTPVTAGAAQNDAKLVALIASAVQKEIEPLLERLEAMDARLRYADILSGVFLIIGLCGIGLWARRRLR